MSKRGLNRSNSEMLEESDRVAENQRVIKPTDAEKGCIASFCTLSLKCKKVQEEVKERLKTIKPIVKQLREEVLQSLKEADTEILQIPQKLRKEANARSEAQGTMPLPAYLRVAKNTKDLTITPEVIEDAFGQLTKEDILEAEGDGTDALISAILQSVRRLVRSFNEQVKLTDSLPRGIKAADVEYAQEDLAHEAIRLHEQSCLVLDTERQKRETISTLKNEMNQRTADVERFFTRANMTSQRVNLENEAYNLCCRTSVSRPKVTLRNLEDFLQDGVKECIIGNSKRKLSKEDVANALSTKRDELQKLLLASLSTVGSVSKTVVHLQKLAVKKE